MPSRDAASVLETIATNVDLAHRFVEGLSREDFLADVRTQYAVTRCLEIISEASRRLPKDVKAKHLTVPWERIDGAGNVHRHDYEDVLASILWVTVLDHLDGVQQAVRIELEAFGA
jgi:uncharacterized protein with HEPN domain